jgi:hypothetical protein
MADPGARLGGAPRVRHLGAQRWVAAFLDVPRLPSRGCFRAAPIGPLGLLIVSLLCGCGAAPSLVAPPEPTPLTEHLPPGASLIVLVRPTELVADPALRRLFDALFLPERLDAFQAFNGVDPRRLEGLAYAEYEAGTVLVVRGGFHATVAVAEMAHRMLPLESQSDEPYFRRAGIYRGERRDAIALDEQTLVVVTGAPVLAGRALAGGRRALDADGRALVEALPAPLVVLWPQPLGFPADTGVGLLFARERALGLALRGAGERVRLEAEARGEFPPGVQDNLRALFSSLARSDLGSAVGMSEAERTFSVDVTPHGVRASAELPAASLARGIRALLIAELTEIVGADLLRGPHDGRSESPGGPH